MISSLSPNQNLTEDLLKFLNKRVETIGFGGFDGFNFDLCDC